MRNVSTYTLWLLVVVYAVAKLVNPVFPLHIPILLVLLIPIIFGLLHGALRYKRSAAVTLTSGETSAREISPALK